MDLFIDSRIDYWTLNIWTINVIIFSIISDKKKVYFYGEIFEVIIYLSYSWSVNNLYKF